MLQLKTVRRVGAARKKKATRDARESRIDIQVYIDSFIYRGRSRRCRRLDLLSIGKRPKGSCCLYEKDKKDRVVEHRYSGRRLNVSCSIALGVQQAGNISRHRLFAASNSACTLPYMAHSKKLLTEPAGLRSSSFGSHAESTRHALLAHSTRWNKNTELKSEASTLALKE